MSAGRSSIDIFKDAIKTQCIGLGGNSDLYSAPYPRPGEPITRNFHVGEYMIVIFRKHDQDVFPLPASMDDYTVEITKK